MRRREIVVERRGIVYMDIWNGKKEEGRLARTQKAHAVSSAAREREREKGGEIVFK
jgi:hypothetical protein